MIYGVSALGAGIPAVIAQAMSFIVFAGSAQFIIAQLVAAGTPALVVVVTAVVVNIRHMLYSASLAGQVHKLGWRWKIVLAYLLTDEAYAVTIQRYQRPEAEPDYKHWYFFGAGLTLWTGWQLSTAVGVFLGAQIPASWSLDFASTLTFIALVVPALKDRANTAAAVAAGMAALVFVALPLKLSIVAAVFIGIAVGLLMETRRKKYEA
ncbi:branched-chain amino acid ABC transporter permease [Dictyobacter alpinus]|uniref:Branched-chain amino acid ABC transporter permease n=2 Tax=Dictyobacter alpinus TaxID=2014873 RepID=A0A402BKJ4_9CHLR|nr:branched-chain amino acid ABC transporter permease [Dictyobacter alpinus]